MIELTVLCEGPTEVGFVAEVLSPHLATRGIYARCTPLNRAAFGTVPYERVMKASSVTVGNSRAHQYTTCMVDLYALQGWPDQDMPARTGREKAERIEAAAWQKMPNPRWIPYIQAHELEALLYTDLGALAGALPQHDIASGLADLKRDVAEIAPEDIDEGRLTAPSKRLLRFVPAYAKGQTAPAALRTIGLPRIRAACPHFDAWLTKLENLAQEPHP